MGKLFGTDGVRGVANQGLPPELAFRLGRAGAAVLAGKETGSGWWWAAIPASPATCWRRPW